MTKCWKGCGEMGACHPNLTDEFVEAVELADEAMAYVDEYFRTKWAMDGKLARLKAIKDKLRPVVNEGEP